MKAMTALFVLSLAASSLYAAEESKKSPSPAQQAQQDKMKVCNADAGEKQLKGDERKQFMSNCLSTKAAPVTQQEKMKICNTDAGQKQLKGDERKQFMSTCLKADKK
jgi:psiF repeat